MIYLASRYSRKDEMRNRAEYLAGFGFTVTSTWLEEKYDPNIKITDIADDTNRELAAIDLYDIDRSDTLIFFAEDQNNQPPRGGRHVEFGYALARGLDIVVIGVKENIFHYLKPIKVYPDWQTFLREEVTSD